MQNLKDSPRTSTREMKAFIGTTMAMSIRRLPRIRNYWNTQTWVLGDPAIMQIFSRNRYLHLYYNLHVVDNQQCPAVGAADHDRLFKLRPVLKKLNDTFAEHYSPCQYLAVDESMVRFKGRSVMKQYMPLKPIKRGFKIWCLSCSCCGYLLSFQMYAGKEKEPAGGQVRSLTNRVVCDLVLPMYGNKNYIVHMDNYFTSLPLIRELAAEGVYVCGTYRTNRVGFPKELADKKALKKHLKERGSCIMRHMGFITAAVWQDKKPVYVVSNAHPPRMTNVDRKNQDGSKQQVQCPTSVQEYNRHMGSVDLSDQLKQYYSYNRKSRRWWLRIFFHLIDQVTVNAYILYKHSYALTLPPGERFKPLDLMFRCKLVEELVDHFTCRVQPGPVVNPTVAIVGSGRKVMHVENISGLKRDYCAFCSTGKNKKRKPTHYIWLPKVHEETLCS